MKVNSVAYKPIIIDKMLVIRFSTSNFILFIYELQIHWRFQQKTFVKSENSEFKKVNTQSDKLKSI